jgi:hypothetical protein
MNQLSIYKLQKLKNSLSHDRIHTYENLTDSNGAKVKLNYSFETTLLLFYLPAWLVYVFFAIFEN